MTQSAATGIDFQPVNGAPIAIFPTTSGYHGGDLCHSIQTSYDQ
jgi:hypothetical protein